MLAGSLPLYRQRPRSKRGDQDHGFQSLALSATPSTTFFCCHPRNMHRQKTIIRSLLHDVCDTLSALCHYLQTFRFIESGLHELRLTHRKRDRSRVGTSAASETASKCSSSSSMRRTMSTLHLAYSKRMRLLGIRDRLTNRLIFVYRIHHSSKIRPGIPQSVPIE